MTICIVDESGNLLFLEKGDAASLNTLQFAQKKARDAAAYGSPSREAAESVKKGNVEDLAFPISSPTREACPFASMASSWAGSRPAAPSLKLTSKLRKQGSMRFWKIVARTLLTLEYCRVLPICDLNSAVYYEKK